MTQIKSPQPTFPAQHQDRQPGLESLMNPLPIAEDAAYVGSSKLKGKVAIISGGDSGIGRAVSLAYAKEGADVVILYVNEHDDAQATKARVEQLGQRCLVFSGDIGNEAFCQDVVSQTVKAFGRIDILV
ncbi:MAG: SDR family NAD(P)-dependent oxidoreductase, partial [Bacillota bacterium]|nr:SDR family NAD(P)-dependent oxidoreductase [Bacillota bacterium]